MKDEKEKIKQKLISLVVEEIKSDAVVGDFEAIEELISMILTKENSYHFIAFLSEDSQKEFFYDEE